MRHLNARQRVKAAGEIRSLKFELQSFANFHLEFGEDFLLFGCGSLARRAKAQGGWRMGPRPRMEVSQRD
jgi:hypothetical protein